MFRQHYPPAHQSMGGQQAPATSQKPKYTIRRRQYGSSNRGEKQEEGQTTNKASRVLRRGRGQRPQEEEKHESRQGVYGETE